MVKKPSLRQRMQYAFDNTLVAGSPAIIGWLAILSLIIVIVFGIVYAISGISMPDTEGMGFFEAAWQTLMRSVDPGTVAGDEGWSFRLVGLLITIGGIFILSTLIGALTTGLEDKLEDLRKGRSLVLESDHTLILGWSDKIYHIVEQLVMANANKPKSRIVVLSRMDKVVMEDKLKSHFDDLRTTKIICRTGSPIDLDDIKIVNPDEAKSIIVLSPENEDPDTYVIKSVLALTNNPQRRPEPYHIVGEIDDDDNIEAAHLVGRDEAQYVRTSSLIARIAAQTCRQSGLSMIYSDLLDYAGDEIYFQKVRELHGKSYQTALSSFEFSSVIGIKRVETEEVLVNPPMSTVIEEGDSIIAVSRDDNTIVYSGRGETEVSEALIRENTNDEELPESNVLLGWNAKGIRIILELDKYVAPGSSMTIVAEYPGLPQRIKKLEQRLKNQSIELISDDITRKDVLLEIDFKSSQNAIILSYHNIPVQEADAKTLITLLHLRNISDKIGQHFNIVSEMGDSRNRELAEVAKADDFIIGDNLISRMLAQLSESSDLKAVFDCLFNAEGAEIYLRDAEEYIKPGAEIDFYALVEAAARNGETAIGYRNIDYARDAGKNYGITLNPTKSDTFKLTANDKVIVLSSH